MKILVINTVEFKLNGITSVIMNYYRKMDKSDLQMDFITINKIDDSYQEEFNKNNSRIYFIERKKNTFKYLLELRKILINNKYDIVHIHGNSATMALETVISKIAKVPVRIIHSHNTTCKYKLAHNILYPVLEKTYTHGFACGEEAGRWLFKDNNFKIIKNGIDLEKFIYNESDREIYRNKINSGERIVLGNIGNFVYQKNHQFLIEVFNDLLKRNKDYLLLLIGEGELMGDIKKRAKELGIYENIVFIGKTTEVDKYLQAIDIFVLPSHFEGLPVVLIEAQALGLKCLASDKVSKDSNITGLVDFLPIDNTNIWVESILEFKKNRKPIEVLSHDKIKTKGYDIEENAKKMKVLYQKYLNEK